MKNFLGETGTPGRWQAWTLKQDKVWVDQQGRVLLVSEIEPRYALNIVKFVYRNHHDGSVAFDTIPLIKKLFTKIKREMGLYHAEIKSLVEYQPEYPVSDFDLDDTMDRLNQAYEDWESEALDDIHYEDRYMD